MGQEWIIYSFVARGMTILAEHLTLPSNVQGIVAQWLQNLPPDPQKKFTAKHDSHSFNFLVEDRYVYGVVARESEGSQLLLFEFLERIKEEFKKKYGHGKGNDETANSLSKKFGPVMKQHMQWVVDHSQEIDKLTKVRAQVSEVQVIISDNVDKILQRGEHITTVVEKAEALHHESLEYNKVATEVKRKMWYKNAKTKLLILGVVLLILALIIWVSICDGFNCSKR